MVIITWMSHAVKQQLVDLHLQKFVVMVGCSRFQEQERWTVLRILFILHNQIILRICKQKVEVNCYDRKRNRFTDSPELAYWWKKRWIPLRKNYRGLQSVSGSCLSIHHLRDELTFTNALVNTRYLPLLRTLRLNKYSDHLVRIIECQSRAVSDPRGHNIFPTVNPPTAHSVVIYSILKYLVTIAIAMILEAKKRKKLFLEKGINFSCHVL